MKVVKNGEKVEMAYADICGELGFIPDVKFVRVTNRGTITFTFGTEDEVRALYRVGVYIYLISALSSFTDHKLHISI